MVLVVVVCCFYFRPGPPLRGSRALLQRSGATPEFQDASDEGAARQDNGGNILWYCRTVVLVVVSIVVRLVAMGWWCGLLGTGRYKGRIKGQRQNHKGSTCWRGTRRHRWQLAGCGGGRGSRRINSCGKGKNATRMLLFWLLLLLLLRCAAGPPQPNAVHVQYGLELGNLKIQMSNGEFNQDLVLAAATLASCFRHCARRRSRAYRYIVRGCHGDDGQAGEGGGREETDKKGKEWF